VQTRIPKLSIVPATVDLSGAELELIDKPRRNFILKDALAEYSAHGASEFSYVLMGTRSQAFPQAVRLAMLWNSESVDQFNAAQRRATLLGLTVTAVELQKLPDDLDAAFRTISDNRVQMLHVLSSPLFFPYRLQISQFAIRNRLPAMFIFRSYAEAGGLMSYGADRIAGAKLLGSYVAKILRGAKPGDLPLDQPTKYELTVNLKTAKAIGVEIPTAILLRADEVIE